MRSIVAVAAGVRELAEEDLSGLSDAALLDRARALHELRCVLDAATAATTGAIHRRGAVSADGAVSTKAWLQGRLRCAPGEANTMVDTAAGLPGLPRFAAALHAGKVTLGHASVAAWLARKVGAVAPELVERAEEMLFPHAQQLNAAQLRQAAKRIAAHLIPERDDPPEPERALFLAQTLGDIWDLKGCLSPEFGAMLQTFFASQPKPDPDDTRSAAERRHDALAALVRRILDSGELPANGGEQPHLAVLVHAGDLRTTATGRHVLIDDPFTDDPITDDAADGRGEGDDYRSDEDWDWDTVADWLSDPHPVTVAAPIGAPSDASAAGVGPIPGTRWVPSPGEGGRTDFGDHLPLAAIQRLACDAAINRIVLGPDDVPLSAGRRTRLVTAPMRRALVVRDQGCRFHYCTRPPQWTQAHHVVPWSDGGPTDLNNLLLLCDFHHHRIHDHGWTLTFDGRTVTIRRPDGTVLDPPPG